MQIVTVRSWAPIFTTKSFIFQRILSDSSQSMTSAVKSNLSQHAQRTSTSAAYQPTRLTMNQSYRLGTPPTRDSKLTAIILLSNHPLLNQRRSQSWTKISNQAAAAPLRFLRTLQPQTTMTQMKNPGSSAANSSIPMTQAFMTLPSVLFANSVFSS